MTTASARSLETCKRCDATPQMFLTAAIQLTVYELAHAA
jgi:hypothetical protein